MKIKIETQPDDTYLVYLDGVAKNSGKTRDEALGWTVINNKDLFNTEIICPELGHIADVQGRLFLIMVSYGTKVWCRKSNGNRYSYESEKKGFVGPKTYAVRYKAEIIGQPSKAMTGDSIASSIGWLALSELKLFGIEFQV